jgi:hypothetical protein
MVHDDQDAGLADASRSACGAKDDVAVPAAEAAEAAEATEEDVSSSDDDGPLGAEGKPQAGQPQGPVRVRRPKCQRCGRQAIQVAEAVARERRKAKERAGKALQRAKLKRQERVAAERTKWRKILAEKLEAVRAKAAADKTLRSSGPRRRPTRRRVWRWESRRTARGCGAGRGAACRRLWTKTPLRTARWRWTGAR